MLWLSAELAVQTATAARPSQSPAQADHRTQPVLQRFKMVSTMLHLGLQPSLQPRQPQNARSLPPAQARSAQACSQARSLRQISQICQFAPADIAEGPSEQGGLEIKVGKQELDGGRVKLTITVPQSTVSHYWEQGVAKKEARSKSSIPPKKQPRKGRIVGREDLKQALVEQLADLALRQAWQAAGLAERVVEDSIEYGKPSDIDPAQDFTFTVEADVVPEVRWKTPYRSLEVELVEPKPADVPALVETHLQAKLRETGALRVVQGRGFQQGDVAVVDFSATNSSGQDVAGLNRPRMRIDSGEAEQLPGLIAGIAGLEPGQQRDFPVPAPAGGGGPPGEELQCHVAMSELLVTEPAQLTDEWVQDTFPHDSLAGVQDLRDNLMQGMQIAQIEQANRQNEGAITSALAAAVEVDVPQGLVVDNARRRFEEQLSNLAQKVPPEQMKQIATEQAFEAYVKQRTPEITETLRAVFALADVAQKEKLTVDQSEVDQSVQRALAQGMEDSEELRDNVAQTMLDEKALHWLSENMLVTRTPIEFSL